MNGQSRRLKPIARRRARDSSGAEGVGKQLCCVQCSDSGTTNSPTRQGSAQNDKIVLYFAKNLVKKALEKNLEQKLKNC